MKTLLILDEHSVAELRGVTFHLNPASKHPINHVMLPGLRSVSLEMGRK